MGERAVEPILRSGRLEDVPTLVKYNLALAKETEDLVLDEARVSKGVRAILEDPGKGAYFVVELGGEVVAQLMITKEWSDWRNAEVWWVQSVYVHQNHRRNGYYRMLYAHVRETAKKAKVGGLRLYADNTNTRAHSTYEAMGMKSHYQVFEEMFCGY